MSKEEKSTPTESIKEIKPEEKQEEIKPEENKEVLKLNSTIDGLKKRQSQSDKERNEAIDTMKKVQEEIETLKKALNEKGIEIKDIDSLQNIKELQKKAERSDLLNSVIGEVELNSKQASLLYKLDLSGKTKEDVKKEAENLVDMFKNPFEKSTVTPPKKKESNNGFELDNSI